MAAVSLVAGCRVLGGVGRAAADRADIGDIGAAQPTPAARLPRNPCVETENGSEVSSLGVCGVVETGSCTDYGWRI